MSITKYTNIDDINNKSSNEGKFIEANDLFIVSKNEIEKTDFGVGKYDVMEVSVYDINNNLLPNISGNNVAYIKKGDIQNYLYNITNKVGQKELAINIEKLLNELGFTNGILKVNINFVRNKVGSDNGLTRVWIQEVSPSREEIRIIPLKTSDVAINNLTNRQFKNLKNLSKEFISYKDNILGVLNSFDNTFLTKIDSYLETKYGKDYFTTLKKDFALNNFADFRKKIFEDFKTSVSYYLNNKHYIISESNFGKPSELRFEDFEMYDYNVILTEIQKILNICIDVNSKLLKRRNITTTQLPKEFSIVELRNQIKNNIESFSTFTELKTNVYNPSLVNISFNDKIESTPIIKPAVIQPVVIEPKPVDIPPQIVGGGGGSGGGGRELLTGDGNSFDRFDRVEER